MKNLAAVLLLFLLPALVHGQCQSGQCQPGQCQPGQSCGTGWQPAANAARPVQDHSIRLRNAYPAMVVTKVSLPNLPSETTIGSGCIVDCDGTWATVLTCAHGYKPGMQVTVYVNGEGYASRVVGADSIQDILVVRIADPGIVPFKVAAAEPRLGERVYACGFASGRDYFGTWGKFNQWLSPDGSQRWTFIETTCTTRDGCSGGPILNARGELIGLITGGGNQSQTTGPCLPRVRAILKFLLPPYPNRPGAAQQTPTPRACLPTGASDETQQVAGPAADTISERLDRIEKMIGALQAKPGVPGPVGPQGPSGKDGKAGPIGPAGKDGILQPIPIDDIVREVIARLPDLLTDAQIASLAKRLPPIYLRAKDPNTGKLSDEIQVRLGEGGIIVITKAVHPVPTSGEK